jgi:hypothetical protein
MNPNVRIELPINCTDENTENDSVSLMFQLPSDGKFAGPDNWIFQKNNEGIKVLKQEQVLSVYLTVKQKLLLKEMESKQ